MKSSRLIVTLSILLCLIATLTAQPDRRALSTGEIPPAGKPKLTTEKAGPLNIQGPFTYKNLDIFLVRGKNQIRKTNFVTLQEALKAERVTVTETGNVNSLAVSSTYDDQYVFIQAGDIVRGGKQDRTLGTDMIVDMKVYGFRSLRGNHLS